MKRKMKWFFTAVVVILLTGGVVFRFTEKADAENAQTQEVVRIGYAQSDEYSSFAQQLLILAMKLEEEGSIREGFSEKYANVNYDEEFTLGDTVTLWNDICDYNAEGAKYQFVREAFFDMDVMPEKEYKTMVNRSDVDLTFVMGTTPGVYFRKHEKENNFMVMLAADPIASRIVKSETEREIENSYALIDNTTYQRQIEAGHKLLKFKKMGIVYEDSESAREYSAINAIYEEAEKLGFEVVEEKVKEPVSKKDYSRYYKEVKEAYRALVEKGIDTLYITVASIDYSKMLPELLNDCIIPNKIPTLAQDDVTPVASGALFGVSLVDYSEQADFIVTQMDRYAKEGVPFDQLDMVCECTPKIFLNYTTAEKIGFALSFEDLQMIDTIYR